MPELPEVETLRRELERALVGQTFKSIRVLAPASIRPLATRSFTQRLKNKSITAVSRRAKMLFLHLDSAERLAIHLKMTGQLIFRPAQGKIIVGGHPENPDKYTRAIFRFAHGDQLLFNDLRRFGWLKIINQEIFESLDRAIGPEPLGRQFSSERFARILQRYPGRSIKQALLDQTLIAGVGNIYADESAARARLRPTRRIKTLNRADKTRLYHALRLVLRLAIARGGTSAKNYLRSNGRPGGFVPQLLVYGRADAPCKQCGKKVKKIRHAGRGTHYCPHCQK